MGCTSAPKLSIRVIARRTLAATSGHNPLPKTLLELPGGDRQGCQGRWPNGDMLHRAKTYCAAVVSCNQGKEDFHILNSPPHGPDLVQ